MIALLVNPNNRTTEDVIQAAEQAARAKRVQLLVLEASSDSELDGAFRVGRQGDGLLVGGDPFFETRLEQLVALASRHPVPAIYPQREFVDAGGSISYANSRTEGWQRQGNYVGKILNGAKPADLRSSSRPPSSW